MQKLSKVEQQVKNGKYNLRHPLDLEIDEDKYKYKIRFVRDQDGLPRRPMPRPIIGEPEHGAINPRDRNILWDGRARRWRVREEWYEAEYERIQRRAAHIVARRPIHIADPAMPPEEIEAADHDAEQEQLHPILEDDEANEEDE
jgi:hypothetical protein